ncbi:hypothetical protein B0J14DRAFT_635514 [Halenospora varia]|nr:hypothetical protein B0J14DRAFT_635514 [Halenospora varia]
MPPKKAVVEAPEPPMTRVYDTKKHDMGKGILSNRNFPAGTRLYSEAAAWTTGYNFLSDAPTQNREVAVAAQMLRLSSTAKAQLKKLNNHFPFETIDKEQAIYYGTPVTGTIRTNAIPLSIDSTGDRADKVGIFGTLSWLNHHCRPNCQQSWNAGLKQVTIHALRDIKDDEELTISYVPEGVVDPGYIADTYGFECFCTWCMLPNPTKEQSEKNFASIQPLQQRLAAEEDTNNFFVVARQLASILEKEKIIDWRRSHLYFSCLEKLCSAESSIAGKEDRIQVFAGLAANQYKICEGIDSNRFGKIRVLLEEQTGKKFKTDQVFFKTLEDYLLVWRDVMMQDGKKSSLTWLYDLSVTKEQRSKGKRVSFADGIDVFEEDDQDEEELGVGGEGDDEVMEDHDEEYEEEGYDKENDYPDEEEMEEDDYVPEVQEDNESEYNPDDE